MPHTISGLLKKLFIASLLSVGGFHAASVSAFPFPININVPIAIPPVLATVYTPGYIYSVAGNGTFDYSGDGGQATSAGIRSPFGVAVDSMGNLYIADSYNNRIRKVDSKGIITTVAGNGSHGYSGDGGLATLAQLNAPQSVAVDSTTGNLYVADTNNNRIRKVDSKGIITTVAGNGTQGYSGDGGLATLAKLNTPQSVAVDSITGNLYVADVGNNRIRKVTPSGIITTVAGNGNPGYSGDTVSATSAQLNYPWGVAVDGAGNLYIADNNNRRIRKVTPSGIITTVAGNGSQGYSGDGDLATSAELVIPRSVAIDSAGNLYITDEGNNRIRKVSASTGIITTVAGNGNPHYSGDGGPATSAGFSPQGIAVDSAGNLYFANSNDNRICMVAAGQTPTGQTSTLGSQSINPITFSPATIAVGGTTTVSATTTSGLAVSFSSTTPTICTVSGSTVTGVATGSCTIAANQAGDASHNAAPQVTGSIQVTGANQGTVSTQSQTISAISFSSGMTSIPLNYELGIRATASSGLAVTFTSLTPDICSIGSGFGGTLVNSISAGTCTIAADQAGNSSYSAAPQVTGSIQVTGANPGTGSTTTQSQTIGAISFSPTTIAVGGTSTVSATASSSLEVVFTSLTPNICTITISKGSLFSADTYTVTGVAAGACTIAANQAGGSSLLSGSYSAAPQVTQNITIGSGQTDCLLNWAEKTYAQYFSPAGATDVTTVAPYTYRYYSGAGNYLAISSADNSVYVLGPVSGNTLVKVGPVTSFLGVSGCQ